MVLQKVIMLLGGVIGAGQLQITSWLRLSGHGYITPIERAKLILACEQEFSITIHDEDAYGFQTLGDLAEYIERLLEAGMTNTPELKDEDRVAWYYE